MNILPVFNFLLYGQKKVAKKSRQKEGFRFPSSWTSSRKRLRGETVRGFPTLEPPFRGRGTRDDKQETRDTDRRANNAESISIT